MSSGVDTPFTVLYLDMTPPPIAPPLLIHRGEQVLSGVVEGSGVLCLTHAGFRIFKAKSTAQPTALYSIFFF